MVHLVRANRSIVDQLWKRHAKQIRHANRTNLERCAAFQRSSDNKQIDDVQPISVTSDHVQPQTSPRKAANSTSNSNYVVSGITI